ncbi:MurR/RpiR family transcriptional regulator [Clostridium sartagoforme]|uniref:MurR/RpiR family transcriptional regulator n=1 Tax=Clostridium sartagoforme TaxID=84031 RepID=A0A4S2DL16_9CLOT|nr:MurR/RpiR family transcriptional regulator [Clostridium sartagoforme]TGY42635.1 MurR/RpiR family transcriptional regulator [Clostridium sartagoforme]
MFSYNKIQSFNELELSLYNYIMKNSEKVIYMRIRELANEAHVSTTTILRFCKKIDCEGFSEFKVKFKMYLEQSGGNILTDNTSMIIDFLKKAQGKEYREKIDLVCEEINKASTIIFVGMGFSGILSKYAGRYLSAIGRNAIYIDDPFYPLNFKPSDNYVAIAFSVSGQTATVINNINRLKEKGCRIVSITNNESSILAKISDINIGYYVQQEKTENDDITTQIPALYIIETIGRKLYKNYKG